MPISCPIAPVVMSQEEFAKLDYAVMRVTFESHNTLGRLCDEAVYQGDLMDRLERSGVCDCHREVPIALDHRGFVKIYSLDLVANSAAIYELKTALQLVPENEAQLLNYLLLWGGQHGKLINFRPIKVESRFVNTNLTLDARRAIQMECQRWKKLGPECELLKTTFLDLLQDWGAFLEIPLYVEALTHFLGGEERIVKMLPIRRGGISLGNQKFHLLTPETCFRITALAEPTEGFERQLRALLEHSPLRAMQWINMNRHRVEFMTLQK